MKNTGTVSVTSDRDKWQVKSEKFQDKIINNKNRAASNNLILCLTDTLLDCANTVCAKMIACFIIQTEALDVAFNAKIFIKTQ